MYQLYLIQVLKSNNLQYNMVGQWEKLKCQIKIDRGFLNESFRTRQFDEVAKCVVQKDMTYRSLHDMLFT